MSNPILTTLPFKLDTRVKEPSGVVPPPLGVGSPTLNRFKILKVKGCEIKLQNYVFYF